MLFVGRAQEKNRLFRTEKRRNPVTGATYPWIVSSTGVVNQFYFYCVDGDFGPFFLKFSSYFPYNAKLCINGNEWAKRQAAKAGIGFTALDNGFADCDDPARLQKICAPAERGEDRRAAAQVAGGAAAPVHPRRPGRRLPLRHLDPAGRVQPDSDAGPATVRSGAVRGGDPGEPRPRPAGQDRAGLRPPDAPRHQRRPRAGSAPAVLTEGVTPSLHVDYKHSRSSSTTRKGRALRTETTINDTRDFAIGRRLCNLPALAAVGFSANRRLLDVERLTATPHRLRTPHRRSPHPHRRRRPAAPALPFDSARTQALLAALVVFRLLPHGFRNRDLRAHLAPLLGLDPAS